MLIARRLLEAPRAASAARLLLISLGVAIAASVDSLFVLDPSNDLLVILTSAAVGVLLLNLVSVRFEAFLLAVLAIRASVDRTKVPCDVGGPTRPHRGRRARQSLQGAR